MRRMWQASALLGRRVWHGRAATDFLRSPCRGSCLGAVTGEQASDRFHPRDPLRTRRCDERHAGTRPAHHARYEAYGATRSRTACGCLTAVSLHLYRRCVGGLPLVWRRLLCGPLCSALDAPHVVLMNALDEGTRSYLPGRRTVQPAPSAYAHSFIDRMADTFAPRLQQHVREVLYRHEDPP